MDLDIVSQNFAKPGMDSFKKQKSEKELKDACAGFEAIFLHSMIKSMRKTLPGDALFDGSHGMDMYKSMYDQYLAEELSKTKTSIGVKEFLYQQLKKSL